MSDDLKITDAPGWVKNSTSKAILNTDIAALQEYKIRKQKNLKINSIENEVDELKNQMTDLKQDLTDIKNILLQFMQNK
jgi:hypothetical protein